MGQTTTDILNKQNIHALSAIFIKQARSVYTRASFRQFLFSLRNEKGAVRIIGVGGFSINMVRVSNTEEVLPHGKHIKEKGLTVIRLGKKNF